jgi:hypothetical protein
MGDVDDPVLYASFPLGKFMETPLGEWITENCKDPQYRVRPDPNTYGTKVEVYGEVEDIVATEYYLKWVKNGST